MQRLNERDELIINDYQEGKTVPEIERSYSVSRRRVYQILKDNGVEAYRNQGGVPKKPQILSKLHQRIGLKVYNHYYDNELDRATAAGLLGWSVAKLRMTERGCRDLSLFDMLDLCEWMKIDLKELVE